MKKNSTRPLELLAPAKNLEGAICAIDYGADALYMGASGFGARTAASNSIDDIAKAVDYAHSFGVKVYAPVNTLIFENELPKVERLVHELYDAKVDALIIQDLALLRMDLPPIALHGSTQMFNMDAQWIKFMASSGLNRVVLERGLTLEQIQNIASQTDIELEAFVHGAICVGYSGRCYLSRTFGDRSGNRGDCMQACRLKYDLVNEQGDILFKNKHLLSVKDLNLLHRIDDLASAGVSSFKIEGRLKGLDYIKNTVSAYRLELDRYNRSSEGKSSYDFTPQLERTFSREGGEYFFDGKRSGVANFDTPKALGAYLGQVKATTKDSFIIDNQNLIAGDGICFINRSSELIGTNINKVEDGKITPNRMDGIVKGLKIYRNFDKKFSDTLENSSTKRQIESKAKFSILDDKLELSITDISGVNITVSEVCSLEMAKNAEKMLQGIETQIKKSGDSIFKITNIEIYNSGEVKFIPISTLNKLRRKALEELRQKRIDKHKTEVRLSEDSSTICPSAENIVNSLSEKFVRDHGVTSPAKPLELLASTEDFKGERVLTSAYCIRREIGECLKNKGSYKGELRLEYKDKKYKLEFDCKNCQMSLIYL